MTEYKIWYKRAKTKQKIYENTVTYLCDTCVAEIFSLHVIWVNIVFQNDKTREWKVSVRRECSGYYYVNTTHAFVENTSGCDR